MKFLFSILFLALVSCNDNTQDTSVNTDTTTTIAPSDTSSVMVPPVDTNHIVSEDVQKPDPQTQPQPKVYANKRFKDVTVENVGENKFRIRGKGQIFEASFSWVIEDGHEELKKGYEMTDAGAPEWGNFDFTVEAVKKRPNSTLHLVIYEVSAKDGSRQYELPIKLF
ncbi:MAG TPA: Gmad2 immunoglobulin-like domain-containing protein [Chitinophagaceae bacterium]